LLPNSNFDLVVAPIPKPLFINRLVEGTYYYEGTYYFAGTFLAKGAFLHKGTFYNRGTSSTKGTFSPKGAYCLKALPEIKVHLQQQYEGSSNMTAATM
jgi:hypothetical protein